MDSKNTKSNFIAKGKIWGGLFHMGVNMWSDQPVDSWGPYKGEDLELVCQKNHLRPEFATLLTD